MSIKNGLLAFAAVLFAGVSSAFALIGTQPVLTNAVRSGDQFQFTLRGETNVAYILETSPDLLTWTPAITNSDAQTARTVIVPATTPQAFWRVRPVPSPLFEHAIVAQGGVILSGSGRIDSFNSTNMAESTMGMYDPSKATDRAVVATTSGLSHAISVGTMQIYGVVATGPGGTVSVGPSGKVGSTPYNNNPAYNGTIEPGHLRDDFRVLLPEPKLPTNFGPPFPVGPAMFPPIGGTNYKYAILSDGDYRIASISLSGGEKMLINARCRIHVLSNTTVINTGYILMGRDASAEWYASGPVSLGGQGCINLSSMAKNLSIFGLSTNPITYGGQGRLIGTIYAPLAPVSLGGTTEAIGAIVSSNFTLTGTMGLHFDESLKGEGPFR